MLGLLPARFWLCLRPHRGAVEESRQSPRTLETWKDLNLESSRPAAGSLAEAVLLDTYMIDVPSLGGSEPAARELRNPKSRHPVVGAPGECGSESILM